jgi:hypothetical protein
LVSSEQGKDRVAVVVALALLFFDPYYRTIKGFEALIKTQFLSFGYPFKTRFGNCQEKSYSPLFLLFLDCVYQAIVQAPLSFEFNQKLLKKLATHTQTLKFGTFLCDSEYERVHSKVNENTISIWSYMKHYNKVEKYRNELYDGEKSRGMVSVDAVCCKLVVWKSFYSKWIPR